MHAMQTVRTFEFEFGSFTRHDRYILGIPSRYCEMGIEEARQINRVIGSLYATPYGYIGDRRHIHSVDPRVYLMAQKESSLLKCVAIVVHNDISRRVAELEKQAADAVLFPFEIFGDIDSATRWVESVLDHQEVKETRKG